MIVAVDTGGTKTLVAAFADDGTLLEKQKFLTPRDKTTYLDMVAKTVAEIVDTEQLSAITIAMPGPIRNGIVVRTPNIGWSNFDVVSELKQRFEETAICLGNDADLGSIGAAHQVPDDQLCLYVTLSTGVGTGLTFQKKLLPALSRFEGGSMRMSYHGVDTRWEDIASGKNFYERYGQYSSDVHDPDIWRDYADRVAQGLLILIPLLQPETIIIGGSMGTQFNKYAQFLQNILDNAIAKHMTDTRIIQAEHPEEIVTYGCYFYAKDQLGL